MTDKEPGASPKNWYALACAEQGILPDEAQTAAIAQLDDLWQQLIAFKAKRNQFLGRSLLSPTVPTGLYLWGGVGRGKTFLMDGFFHCLPYRRKRRIHFHPFMAEVHREMKRMADSPDPLIAVADELATSTRVLCLDEFHIDDIADAMIMGRLLAALFERGVILLTTSNYPPEALYPNGLQRERFLPAIDLLKENLNQIHIHGSNDYRLLKMARESLFLVPDDAHSRQRMHTLFAHLTQHSDINLLREPASGLRGARHPHVLLVHSGACAPCAPDAGSLATISVAMFESPPLAGTLQLAHESIPVIGCEEDTVWFDFKTLCGGNHDQTTYLEIARNFQTVFLSGIPLMGHDNGAEARRFTWLIDVLYDHHIKLVASAAATPGRLYLDAGGNNDYLRTASRLAEMQTRRYLENGVG
jgi:cell division protein ZapE